MKTANPTGVYPYHAKLSSEETPTKRPGHRVVVTGGGEEKGHARNKKPDKNPQPTHTHTAGGPVRIVVTSRSPRATSASTGSGEPAYRHNQVPLQVFDLGNREPTLRLKHDGHSTARTVTSSQLTLFLRALTRDPSATAKTTTDRRPHS